MQLRNSSQKREIERARKKKYHIPILVLKSLVYIFCKFLNLDKLHQKAKDGNKKQFRIITKNP